MSDEEKRGYARGYATGRNHDRAKLTELESELAKLKAAPATQEGTIDYLIHTADVMLQAARLLIEMRRETDTVATTKQNEPGPESVP